MMYVASPIINIKTDKGTITRQVPTFYLDGNIQGIVDVKHAGKIVADICNPLRDVNIIVHPNVYKFKMNIKVIEYDYAVEI